MLSVLSVHTWLAVRIHFVAFIDVLCTPYEHELLRNYLYHHSPYVSEKRDRGHSTQFGHFGRATNATNHVTRYENCIIPSTTSSRNG